MAGSLNKVMLIGHLGADPEVRSLSSGSKVVSLRLATSESWRDKNSGERKEKTEWHNVVIFNEGLVKVAEQYLEKGAKIYIEGQLQTRQWEDKDGNKRYTTEIVLQNFRGELQMLDSKGDSEGRGGGGRRGRRDDEDGGGRRGREDREERSERRSNRDMDDEIPF